MVTEALRAWMYFEISILSAELGSVAILGGRLRDAYDTVLAHEHLLIDIRCWHDDTHAATATCATCSSTPEPSAASATNPFACLDNLVLDDEQTAAEELALLGGSARRS